MVEDAARDIRTPADALALGIRMLPQELSIFPDITVAENIMIGALPKTGWHVDRATPRGACRGAAAPPGA